MCEVDAKRRFYRTTCMEQAGNIGKIICEWD